MKTFYFGFKGREVGAIGVADQHHKTVVAETLKDAVLSLYNDYEHISIFSIDIFDDSGIIRVARGFSDCLRLTNE